MTNLLDLPLSVLVRIAAFVSGGKPCSYTNLHFQFTCGRSEWNNLLPLRQTCKILFEASDVAVGGLKLSFLDVIVPVKAVRCMPCVCQLTITDEVHYTEAGFTLLQQLSSLKYLKLHLGFSRHRLLRPWAPWDKNIDVHSKIASFTFPSCRTLRELVIHGHTPEVVARILSFPYECLTKLDLEHLDDPERIPRCIWRTLKSLIVRGLVARLLLATTPVHATEAPLLEYVELAEPQAFPLIIAFQPEHRFKRLETLSLVRCPDLWGPAKSLDAIRIVEAAENGCFTSLKKLEIDYVDSFNIPEVVSPIMKSCRSTLKTLKLNLNTVLTPADFEVISAVDHFKDIDLDLSILSGGEHLSVEHLAKIESLTCLSIDSKQVVDICRLTTYPKLRVVKFFYCELSLSEKNKMLKAPGNLKCMEFIDCVLFSQDDKGNKYNAVKRYNLAWSGLREN